MADLDAAAGDATVREPLALRRGGSVAFYNTISGTQVERGLSA